MRFHVCVCVCMSVLRGRERERERERETERERSQKGTHLVDSFGSVCRQTKQKVLVENCPKNILTLQTHGLMPDLFNGEHKCS